MSAELAIQQAIYAKLRTAAAIVALLADDLLEASPSAPGVYDHVPQVPDSENAAYFPYVVIGDDTAAEFDTDDVNGQETTVTLHVWDRRRGRARAKQVIGAIYSVLHNQPLEVSGQHVVFCFWEFSGSIPDPDLLTQHEVTRFRIATQES